jgi:hypothetical protein
MERDMSEDEHAVAPLIEAMAKWQEAKVAAELASELATTARLALEVTERMHASAQAAADAARRSLEAAQQTAEATSGTAEDARAANVTAAGESARMQREASAARDAETTAETSFRDTLARRDRPSSSM